jgi:hypothetical protein
MTTTELTESEIWDLICATAKAKNVWPTVDDLFAYECDADAKLMHLAVGGHLTNDDPITLIRIATGGPDEQIWEFRIDATGQLYLLHLEQGMTFGFEPKDAGSFDRMASKIPNVELHDFA